MDAPRGRLGPLQPLGGGGIGARGSGLAPLGGRPPAPLERAERSESDSDETGAPPRVTETTKWPPADSSRSRSRSKSPGSAGAGETLGLAAEVAEGEGVRAHDGPVPRSGASSRRGGDNASRRQTRDEEPAPSDWQPSRRPSGEPRSPGLEAKVEDQQDQECLHQGDQRGESSRQGSRRGTTSGEPRQYGFEAELAGEGEAPEGGYGLDAEVHEHEKAYDSYDGDFALDGRRHSNYEETVSELVQSPDRTVMVTEVDLKVTAQKLKRAFTKDTMQYMRSLGPLEWKAQPSVLQGRLKRGHNTMEAALRPELEEDGLYLARFNVDSESNIMPMPDVPQVKMELNHVKGMPPKIVRHRPEAPQLRLARIGFWDTQTKRFHGNVQAVISSHTSNGGATWHFDKKNKLVLRCLNNSPSLHILLEFNVSYALTAAEAHHLPSSHRKAASQVDEVTVAWALIPFQLVARTSKPTTEVAPLMCGRLMAPVALSHEVYLARKKRSFLKNLSSMKPNPVLSLKFRPVSAEEKMKERFSLLPDMIVADSTTAVMVACFRAVLAAQLARVPTYMSTVSDPVVAAFPKLMDDPQERVMLHRLWDRHVSGLREPSFSQLVLMFRQVVTMLWPAIHAQGVPQSSIMNFNVHQGARMHKLTEITSTHPVVTLSHSAYNWLHRPLDAAELSYSYSDALGPSV